MTHAQVYTPDRYKAMPWKNGAGMTLEILQVPASPGGAYDWRLSIARVDANGPFSVFPGYRRIITVLDGGGMVLEVNGVETEPLMAYTPFSFDGAANVNCRLLGSAIQDLNLIYHPGRVRAATRWVSCQPATTVSSQATEVVFFNPSATPVKVTAVSSGRQYALGQWATLRVSQAAGLPRLYSLEATAAQVCVVEVDSSAPR